MAGHGMNSCKGKKCKSRRNGKKTKGLPKAVPKNVAANKEVRVQRQKLRRVGL